MPVQLKHENGKCWAQWGDKGAHYEYECGNEESMKNAKEKAIKQGVAIGDFAADSNKVSLDYDDTLSTPKGKELAKRLISEGKTVYIITRRNKIAGSAVYNTAKEVGIPADRVYFTGGKLKWEEVKRLGIGTHYDNNANEIAKIEENTDANGILFK